MPAEVEAVDVDAGPSRPSPWRRASGWPPVGRRLARTAGCYPRGGARAWSLCSAGPSLGGRRRFTAATITSSSAQYCCLCSQLREINEMRVALHRTFNLSRMAACSLRRWFRHAGFSRWEARLVVRHARRARFRTGCVQRAQLQQEVPVVFTRAVSRLDHEVRAVMVGPEPVQRPLRSPAWIWMV
jgi:hypothetical protein